MAAGKTTIKPYKLKASGESLSRDDLSTWREVTLSHMRQNEAWRNFLPGASGQDAKNEWKAQDSGEDNGWDAAVTASHADFITCLSTFSPAGLGETIKRESTSFNWVIDLIKETFGLKTRGEHFLALDDLKFDFSSGCTYQMAFMEVKDFICAGLLNDGDRFENKNYNQKEVLTPVAKNFIVKEWLNKIDSRLPKHIRETRGHLFTEDKPTLACNQKIICNQIPTLLAELDDKTDASDAAGDTVTVGYVPAGRRPPRNRGGGRGSFRNYPPRALPPPVRPQYQSGCRRCIEAIPQRLDAARTHATSQCMWPPNPPSQNFRQRPNFRVVLIPNEDQGQTSEDYYDHEAFQNQFYDANFEDVTDDYDNKDSAFYSCSSPNFQSISSSQVHCNALPIRKVQTISAKINGVTEALTIDSGSEGNCIRLDTCSKLSLSVLPLDKDDQSVPTQADGQSPLHVVGQTEFVAVRNEVSLHWKGYVTKTLSAPILCGGPFIEQNKLVQELHNNRVIVDGKHYFLEDSPFNPQIQNISLTKSICIGSNVPKHLTEKLHSIHVKHENVFDGDLSGGYNGVSGNFDVNFNFKGNIPPVPNYDSAPCYYSNQDKQLLQAKIDELEAKGVCMKVTDSDIIPRYAAPCMLVKKHSVRDLQPGQYENLTTEEKLKYNRFILCHNKLSEHIEKLPAKMNKLDDIIRTVGSFEFIITSDLSDSFWQRHIAEDKLPYFAFHSPFRGPYIFLRSTQGLINQSEGLEELVSVILQDCVMSGWVIVLADNLYVMGHTMEETVKRWQLVLDLLAENNIKLSPKKTACFPDQLDLLGWTKQGKYLVPDSHRQNVIAKAPLPKTIKNLRSFLGAYRTFFRSKTNMSSILRELEELQAGKMSSEKIVWTKPLEEKFEMSKREILKLDKLYLPKPDDQLVMTSDWSEKGISCTLWAIVDNDPRIISHFSAKIERNMEKMLESGDVKPKTLPCDGEMTAVYVGIKSPVFGSHIRASNNRTVCLVDNKPVVEAAKLIKDGKFSSSRVINNLMTALAEYNLEFQHLSSKMGQNLFDDFGSRNPVLCNKDPSCKICNFIKDCQDLTIGSLSFSGTEECLIGNVEKANNLVQDILRGKKSIPFNNRKALKFLQDKDPDLLKVRDYLLHAKRPRPKDTKENKVKRYLQKQGLSIAKDGCIVVTKRDKYLNNRELVVIPCDVSVGLVYALHINLNHPTNFQLSKLLDTKFYILDKESKVKKITESCTLCQSVAKIPREIESFKANTMPDHPGNGFTVDILKMNKKNILVAVENFSGFLSTTFINSETAKDLLEGILITTTPFRSSFTSKIHIRVDQAPGFRSLSKQDDELEQLGITLELGQAKNKNAVSLVDKKIKELEDELRKVSNNSILNVKLLTKATSSVNEKIRHQGLSAKEIIFSRDQFSQDNLNLNDEQIATDKMIKREINNRYSAKSKAQIKVESKPANAKKGQIVLLKHEITKHSRRELYLVLDTDQTNQSLVISKLPHALSGTIPVSFQPHNIRYIVKQTDVVLSPNQPQISQYEPCLHHFDDPTPPSLPPPPKTPPPKPTFPYDTDSDDDDFDLDLDDDLDDNSEDDDAITSSTDNAFDSLSDHDADNEISNEPDDILEQNGAIALQVDPPWDQSHIPKKGEIVSFVYGENWVKGKILHKAKTSDHFNIELQDGAKIGVFLRPNESWSLLPPEEWQPEQLRINFENDLQSREASPMSDYQRDYSQPSSPVYPLPLQLSLSPNQPILAGQVYNLPQTIHVQVPNQTQIFELTREEYEKRYIKLIRSVEIPSDQRHIESSYVKLLIYNQLSQEQNSSSNKFMQFFNKKK